MIYFDNSATTLVKPKDVQNMVELAMNKYSANPGRSGHKLSLETASLVEETRAKIADFFNLSRNENVIFTENCSSSLNIAILGSAKIGGHIITTENEHNSVLRPIEHLRIAKQIEYSIAKKQPDSVGICLDDIKKHIKDNTYMIICNHISNVNGDIANIEEIGKFCKEKNLLFLVDAAQSAGHEIIDMQNQHISMLTIAPHKGFYSLQGLGVLLINENINLSPVLFGGTGTNSLQLTQPLTLPESLEVGTKNTPAILSLYGGLDFVKKNYSQIVSKLDDLTTYCHYEFSKLPVKIYTHSENGKGVFAFNIANIHSIEVATFLDQKYGICCRSGYQCAAEKHKSLNTLETGVVRFSFSYFNNFFEIQKSVSAIKSFITMQKKLNKQKF